VEPAAKKGKLKLLLIDEANRFFPSPHRPMQQMAKLVDFHRHWAPTDKKTLELKEKGLAVVLISRRPVQLCTNVIELADYNIFFNLSGKNDIDYLNSLCRGLGEEVAKLPDFHFVLRKGRDFQLCSPMKI